MKYVMHGSTGTVAFVEEVIMNRFGPLCCNVFIIVSQRGAASSSTCPSRSLKPLAAELVAGAQLVNQPLLLCIDVNTVLLAGHGPSLSWQYCNEAEIWAH